MSRMLFLLAAALALGGCRFAPTVEGKPIAGCSVDADCPVCGSCLNGVCVPVPPSTVGFEVGAELAVVDAGANCHLVVSDVDPTCERSYRWRQISGPDVELAGTTGDEQTFATFDDYVGAYIFEAQTGEGEALRTARGSCTALMTQDAGWIVAGASGSCTQTDPCGSFAETQDPMTGRLPRRVYLGVAEAAADGTPVVISPVDADGNGSVTLPNSWDPIEIHGGFIYPGWRRDLERARTALSDPVTGQLFVECWECQFTGLSEARVVTNQTGPQPWVMGLLGGAITLRQSRIELLASGAEQRTGGAHGLVVYAPDSVLEDLTVVAAGDFGDVHLTTVEINTGGDVSAARLEIDSSAAFSDVQQGLSLRRAGDIDRVRITTGEAVGWLDGLFVDCGPARVSNALIDARIGRPRDSYALSVGLGQSCSGPWQFHSVLALGGDGDQSIGLMLSLPPGADGFSMHNSIIDAGRAPARYAVAATPSYVAELGSMESSVLIVDPTGVNTGEVAGRDPDGSYSFLAEPDLVSVLGCLDCLTVVESVPFVDPGNGDFHPRADADCCVSKGALLGPDDPKHDLDGRPRPTAPLRPTIGPYEPRPAEPSAL